MSASREQCGEEGLVESWDYKRDGGPGNFSVAFYITFLVKIVIMNFLFDHSSQALMTYLFSRLIAFETMIA